jgi:putative membrane protein
LAPAEPVFYRIEKEMEKLANYFASCLLLGGLALLHAPQAHAQNDVKEANKLNKQRNKLAAKHTDLSKNALNYDAEFLVAAASSNQLEIALGQLAQKKGIAAEVRTWGQQMEQTHGQAEQELQAIAGRANLSLPANMSPDDRKLYDDVDDRNYLGFDKKYMRTLKELHARTIRRYAEAVTKLTNPELQAYAARRLPLLSHDEDTVSQLFDRANARK